MTDVEEICRHVKLSKNLIEKDITNNDEDNAIHTYLHRGCYDCYSGWGEDHNIRRDCLFYIKEEKE